MSHFLTENRLQETGRNVYAPTQSLEKEIKEEKGALLKDTLEFGLSGSPQLSVCSVGDRVTLPKPSVVKSQDDLTVLAEAFAKAFEAMSSGLQEQTQNFAQMQKFDQTESESVLSSTTDAINKEEAAAVESAKIAAYAKKMGGAEAIFGYVMLGLTIAISIGCIAYAVVVSFAAPALISDGIELADLGEETDLGYEGESDGEGNTINFDENIESDNTDTDDDAVDKSVSNRPETNQTIKKFGKLVLKIILAASCGSPMLMRSIVDLGYLSPEYNALSKDQKTVGTAMEKMQLNNMMFNFLQQLTQREGTTIREEASDASEVIDTFASITSAYRSISYGLANAV